MSNPSHSFILLIGDETALLLPPQHLPDADPLFAESHEDKDAQPLIEAISLAPHLPIMILNDCSNQDYTYENIPALSTTDRKKLLTKRLSEAFPEAAYRTSLIQKNNKALMIGVKETKALAKWQERIEKLQNSSGIVSLLPLESADMITALWPEAKEGWTLMLSFHRTGGTRQIVTHNGEIVFTRLTAPLSTSTSIGYMSATIAVDIKATRDYLLRMGYSNEMPFHLVAIMPPNMLPSMKATPLDVSSRHFFTPHEAAIKLDLPFAPEKDETISDLIHALWYAQRSEPKAFLAKASKIKELFQIKIHKIGMSTAIFMALVAGVLIGMTTLDFLNHQRILYEIQYDINQMENSYTKLQNKLTTATEPLNRLRMAVQRKRLFKKEEPTPLRILSALEKEIGEDARIYDLSWNKNKMNLTLRLTDPDLIKQPLHLNKDVITERVSNIKVDLQAALQKTQPKATLRLVRSPFKSTNNQELTEKDNKTDKPALASYEILWGDQ